MIENLFPLRIPPGIYRNGTKYESGGRLYDYWKQRTQEGCRWYDGNGVRFIDGTIRPIGGWQGLAAAAGGTLAALSGVPRGALSWRSSAGVAQIAVGTNTKLYLIAAGATTDITPVGITTGAANSTYSSGGGYGAGAYGAGAYGVGTLTPTLVDADTWQLDALGNTLAAVLTSDGKLYTSTGGVATQAAGSPTQNRGVVITPERFLVALGGNDGTGQDVRRAQWADQNTTTVWTPSATNAAGSFPLATNGRLMCGRRTKALTLLFTDADLWTMNYIGGLLVYSFAQVADNCGIIAPNAVATVGDTAAFWMGKNSFWMYDGYAKEVPCEVRDYVFGNFNTPQAAKVTATTVGEFGEVWWFYPSAGATENDSYVIYNYRESHWSFGKLARTSAVDRGAATNPVFFGADGSINEHEVPGLNTRTGMTPYLESGPLELGPGDTVARVQRIVPDELALGDLQMYLYGAMYPTATETEYGPFSATNPTDVRITARQVRLRLQEVNQVSWRAGKYRLGVIEGGRR